jgi:hypothetical protein
MAGPEKGRQKSIPESLRIPPQKFAELLGGEEMPGAQ